MNEVTGRISKQKFCFMKLLIATLVIFLGFELIEEWDKDGDGEINQKEYLATFRKEEIVVEENKEKGRTNFY